MIRQPFADIAEANLTIVVRGGSEWMCACPYCGRKASLQFNVIKGLFNCFGCGIGGSAKKLIKHLGGSYRTPGINLGQLQQQLDILNQPEPDGPRIYPESYLARYGGAPHEYWIKDRGFTEDTVRRWGLGFDPLGPTLAHERVGPGCTIPFRDPEGHLLGVIFRRLGDGFPRYIYPRGFDRLGSLFGSWNLRDVSGKAFKDPVVIVEGSTDCIRVCQSGIPAVAQYGSSISPRQVMILRRASVREVVLFYDYDTGGIKATKQARSALDGFIIRAVNWDSDVYCWHGKLCGCPERHQVLDPDFAQCRRKVRCRCGRIHEPDPGKLSSQEILDMVSSATLVGRPKPWRGNGRGARSGAVKPRRKVV